jgi:hypothetical protein
MPHPSPTLPRPSSSSFPPSSRLRLPVRHARRRHRQRRRAVQRGRAQGHPLHRAVHAARRAAAVPPKHHGCGHAGGGGFEGLGPGGGRRAAPPRLLARRLPRAAVTGPRASTHAHPPALALALPKKASWSAAATRPAASPRTAPRWCAPSPTRGSPRSPSSWAARSARVRAGVGVWCEAGAWGQGWRRTRVRAAASGCLRAPPGITPPQFQNLARPRPFAGNYGMCGGAYGPSFLCMWPWPLADRAHLPLSTHTHTPRRQLRHVRARVRAQLPVHVAQRPHQRDGRRAGGERAGAGAGAARGRGGVGVPPRGAHAPLGCRGLAPGLQAAGRAALRRAAPRRWPPNTKPPLRCQVEEDKWARAGKAWPAEESAAFKAAIAARYDEEGCARRSPGFGPLQPQQLFRWMRPATATSRQNPEPAGPHAPPHAPPTNPAPNPPPPRPPPPPDPPTTPARAYGMMASSTPRTRAAWCAPRRRLGGRRPGAGARGFREAPRLPAAALPAACAPSLSLPPPPRLRPPPLLPRSASASRRRSTRQSRTPASACSACDGARAPCGHLAGSPKRAPLAPPCAAGAHARRQAPRAPPSVGPRVPPYLRPRPPPRHTRPRARLYPPPDVLP